MSAVVNNNASDVRFNAQNAWTLDTTDAKGAGSTKATGAATGAGAIAGVTAVPDAAAPTVMMAMMASVDAIMPKMGSEDLDALITSFTSKLKDTIDKSDKDQVKNEQNIKRGQIAEKKEKYKEAAQKIQDAKDAFAKAGVGDKIKLAFQYIGAIMTIIAGIAAIAVSVLGMVGTLGLSTPASIAGIVGGSLLITSGLIMLTMAVDQTVTVATADENGPGMGMFGRMVKACAKAHGQSDADADAMAKKGAMGISIGLMVIACVTGAVGMMLQPEDIAFEGVAAVDDTMAAINEADVMLEDGEQILDLSERIETGADMGDELASAGQDFGDLGENLETVGDDVQKGGTIGKVAEKAYQTEKVAQAVQNDANTYATAASDVSSAVYNKDATDDQADAKRSQADAKSMEALGKTLDDFIDMAIARLKGSAERFSAMVDSAQEAIQDRADTLSRARLSA